MRIRSIGYVLIGITFFHVWSGAQEKKEAKVEPQLDENSYRFKVEPILDRNNYLAVFRVQVWTVDERHYSEIGYGGSGRKGLFRRGKDDKLFRGEFVLVFQLRPAEDLKRADGKGELEVNLATVGDPAVSTIIDDVEADATLAEVLDVKASEGICKFTSRQTLGRCLAKPISVFVR